MLHTKKKLNLIRKLPCNMYIEKGSEYALLYKKKYNVLTKN